MSKKHERFEDIEIYDVAMSATGINAYYIDTCAVVGQRPSYASCLAKVAARKEGRLPTAQAECSAAIGKCECPAQAMRKQELDAGQAMFFINRKKLNAFVAEQEGITREALMAMPQTKTPPSPKKAPVVTTTGGYEDAINAAMKKLTAPAPAAPAAPAAPKVQPATTVVPAKAGMSLLELARMQLAAKQQAAS